MKRRLSKTKLEIMELFWNNDKSFSFSEVMEYFSSEKGKEWKKQTLSTFLRELISEGFLKRGYKGRNAFYTPLITKEQYELGDVKDTVEKKYHGRVVDFITALVGNYTITEEDKDELIDFIKKS